jgi:hypothetical protein
MLRHRLAVPLLVLAAAVAIPLARSPARAATTAVVDQRPACGTERWPVKVFEDPDAGLVDMSQAVPESVADLVRVPPPANLPDDRRLSPVELTLYSVTARLVEAKREEDSDFHVVIADPDTNDTMIVELPDAARCAPGASGDHVAEMQAARNAFIARFGTPSSDRFVPLSGTAQIIGLGFFDFLHGQTGVAPNAIELHPVLWFTVTSSSTPVTGTITPLAPTPEGEIPSAAEVTIVSVEGGIVGGPATLSAQAPARGELLNQLHDARRNAEHGRRSCAKSCRFQRAGELGLDYRLEHAPGDRGRDSDLQPWWGCDGDDRDSVEAQAGEPSFSSIRRCSSATNGIAGP